MPPHNEMLDAIAFAALVARCAPDVHPTTMETIVRTESSLNPYAIAIAGKEGRAGWHLQRQPRTLQEAIDTADELIRRGLNFSAGAGQINYRNWPKYGLNTRNVFDACTNLHVASQIYVECVERAKRRTSDEQHAYRLALSCYNSGNFTTGFREGYVQQALRNIPKSTQKTRLSSNIFRSTKK
ncbi:MAG TPA: lytic transglycosylase domain-containing protein [Noviherbaspirillum sp.]|nr:lytic transglycosylase domain-containing protein [Noviherbaspirillum sp.]